MKRLLLACLALLAALTATAAGSPSVGLSDARSFPLPNAVLAMHEPFWIEIAYASGTPLRIKARAYRDGRSVDEGQKMNASAVHPAGTGSALVWVAFYEPATIDEIRVTAYDASFNPIATHVVRAGLRWTHGGERRPTPGWVEALMAEERSLAAARPSGDFDEAPGYVWLLLTLAVLGGFPAYLYLQVRSLRRWRGGWRIAAAAPLLGMAPVVFVTVPAFLSGANLWPLGLVFASPPACLYLLALMAGRRFAARSA
jgi:hypothetical protein